MITGASLVAMGVAFSMSARIAGLSATTREQRRSPGTGGPRRQTRHSRAPCSKGNTHVPCLICFTLNRRRAFRKPGSIGGLASDERERQHEFPERRAGTQVAFRRPHEDHAAAGDGGGARRRRLSAPAPPREPGEAERGRGRRRRARRDHPAAGAHPRGGGGRAQDLRPAGQVRRLRHDHLGRPRGRHHALRHPVDAAPQDDSRLCARRLAGLGAGGRRVGRGAEERVVGSRAAHADLGRSPSPADLAHQRQVRRRVDRRHRQERRAGGDHLMKDFRTKSIFKIPNQNSDHHGVFTDNSEYIIVSTFFPTPFDQPNGYAPIEDYRSKYKGVVSFLRFDRQGGRIVPEESFQIELPPYFQDLSIAGRGPSDGFFFINSMNVEMATGGDLEGKPPMEIGASQREMDYLHVIDWKKAAEVAKDPAKVKVVNGMKVIPLPTVVAEKLMYFVPESKSPHGVDLVPGGEYVVVSGKLDPHVSVYSVEKIKRAIAEQNFEGHDDFGIPILKYDACLEAHVQVGLGPLHSVFDDKGNGYTSCFLDSTVVKWTLGPPYNPPEKAWQAVDKVSIHYNIGHLQAPGSNTRKPWGKYLVALNKWSVDRYPPLGPLHPQNLQLIDISGPKMRLLSDTPTIGEPHNSMIIPVEMLQAWTTYPETGFDPVAMKKSPYATEQGK